MKRGSAKVQLTPQRGELRQTRRSPTPCAFPKHNCPNCASPLHHTKLGQKEKASVDRIYAHKCSAENWLEWTFWPQSPLSHPFSFSPSTSGPRSRDYICPRRDGGGTKKCFVQTSFPSVGARKRERKDDDGFSRSCGQNSCGNGEGGRKADSHAIKEKVE